MTSIVLWICLNIIIILLWITSSINRTSKYISLIVILILISIFTGVFLWIPYITSYNFYKQYVAFQTAIGRLTPSQEYICIDDAIALRRQLIIYQTRLERYGSFAPYYAKLNDLYPIELINFNLINFG